MPRVEGVTVYDHRRGNASIAVGSGGLVRDTSNAGNSLPTAQFGALFGSTRRGGRQRGLLDGVVAVPHGHGRRGHRRRLRRPPSIAPSATAGGEGIHAKGLNAVPDSTGGGYGNPRRAGLVEQQRPADLERGVVARGFRGGGTSLYCVLPEVGSGFNFIVQNAFCDGNVGAKFIVQNAGNQYSACAARGADAAR